MEKMLEERVIGLEHDLADLRQIITLLRAVYDRDIEVRAQNAMNELLDKLKL